MFINADKSLNSSGNCVLTSLSFLTKIQFFMILHLKQISQSNLACQSAFMDA